ncbi:MAG: hypothetical protein A2X28_06085 [Elusimicrobia bacterium GWA2_56_46]|nr:MAG: hypothetical protein A2X28_06085 [Elusimicrobia bacterium GWA2_56_46]OGR54601.1 MAG: hypothetical protein A2X39_02135 [Elusimicrobia bacterium GWC2_56_31]HBB67635.1 hypothetical protein [Elusimicrobiota bacterium]HBW23917.1 hypothetical protein [Elusimicrobiota bacterium]
MTRAFKNLSLMSAFLSFFLSTHTSVGAQEPPQGPDEPEAGCAAMEALGASGNEAARESLLQALNDPDPAVQACAVRAAGRSGDPKAVDALLSGIETYLKSAGNRGDYEEDLQARLKAIDSIWALGETGDARLMNKLSKFYRESDDVLRINLIISMGKLRGKAAPNLTAIAASGEESEAVRAAAFEMLDELGQPAPNANLSASRRPGIEKADLIYTGGVLGTITGWGSGHMPVGHTGIFAGTEIKNGRINVVILDCVQNILKPYGGVRNIYSWKNFTHYFKFPYYGNRTTRPRPTAAQRDLIVKTGLALGKLGLKYNNSHLSQKGPLEFDCVGYTEYLYEQAGPNPTDNSFESGLGWPLTPWEQFMSVKPSL